MAIVTINDDYLDNIADAIREKGGTVPTVGEAIETKVSKTVNATGFDSCSGNYGNNRDTYDVVTITGATTIKVKMAYQTEAVSFDYVQVAAGSLSAMPEGTKKYGGPDGGIVELTFENTDTVTFYFHSDETTSDALGYYAEVSGYGATETRSTTYRPKDMSTAIQSIVTGAAGGGEVNMVEVALTGKGSSTGMTPFNVYDYVENTEDIVCILVRLQADKTNYLADYCYIKDFGFLKQNVSNVEYFTTADMLGAITNPYSFDYIEAATYPTTSSAEACAFGIKSGDGKINVYKWNGSNSKWTVSFSNGGTTTKYMHIWMLYK